MAWWKSAKVGDKVVCVNLAEINPLYDCAPPNLVIGQVYKIIHIECLDKIVFFDVGLNDGNGVAAMLSAAHFRPVEPKSTKKAMEALRSHLNTNPASSATSHALAGRGGEFPPSQIPASPFYETMIGE